MQICECHHEALVQDSSALQIMCEHCMYSTVDGEMCMNGLSGGTDPVQHKITSNLITQCNYLLMAISEICECHREAKVKDSSALQITC